MYFNSGDGPVAGLGIGLTLAAEYNNGFDDGYQQARQELKDEANAAYDRGWKAGHVAGWNDALVHWENDIDVANQTIDVANQRIRAKNDEISKLKAQTEAQHVEIIRLRNELAREKDKIFHSLRPLMDEKKVKEALRQIAAQKSSRS